MAILLAFLAVVASDAQTHETTLGVVRTLRTPGTFRHLRQLPSSDSSRHTFVLWNDTTPALLIGQIDSTFSSFREVPRAVRTTFDDLIVARITHRLKPDFLLLNKSERTISVYTDSDRDSLDPVSTVTLPFSPSGWQVADINNDGNADVVVYDRNNPGIVPLYGDGRGRLVVGRTIAPAMPVGCLAITNLNNDNLSDMVVYDWVKSELHLLYGVGRGRFLDQSTFPVQGDVQRIIPARMDPESNLDLVLVTGTPAEVQDWQGNGIGDFRLTKRATLGSGAIAYALGDVNDDQWQDFGYIDRAGSLGLIINNGSEWAQDRVQFDAGTDPTDFLLSDFNGDGKTDALILDRTGQSLRFLFNGSQDNTLVDSLEFATGKSPAGLEVHASRSGVGQDLAVVNSGDLSLSLLTQREHGGLLGQTTYALSVAPRFVSFHSATDSSSRYVVTSVLGDSLVFLSLNFKDSSSSYAVIPSEGSAELCQVGIHAQGEAEFFTFNTTPGDQNPSIHYYERLNPGTFIEQSFRLNKPDVLLGATAGTIKGDSYPDLIYIYRNADSGNVDLAVSYGDSLMTYSQRHFTLELPRMNVQKSYLWVSRLSAADTADLLVYFSDPVNDLDLFVGRGGGKFDSSVTILQHVSLTSRSMLRIVDADHDGIPDIVLNDGQRKEIGWLRGNGDGTFASWQPLAAADSAECFAVGDLNGDGIAELVLSLKNEGVVKIYNGVLMFTREKHAASE